MQPLTAAVEYDFARVHLCAAQHRQRTGIWRKRHKGQPRRELHIGYALGLFLTPQYVQMVQLRPGEARSKLVARQDDGFDLCLAQARLVMIGLEEGAPATARHLSSCRNQQSAMRPTTERRSAEGGGLCRFCGSRRQPNAFARLKAIRRPAQCCRRRFTEQRAVGNDPIPRTRNQRRSR
jgi:hypothetical protein